MAESRLETLSPPSKAARALKGSDGEPLIIPAHAEKEMTKKICTRQFITDCSGDGKLDLFVGDSTTLSFPKEGVSKADQIKKLAEYERANAEAMKKYTEAAKDVKNLKPEQREVINKASQELSKAQQLRAEVITEEMTGFVWLYLQKQRSVDLLPPETNTSRQAAFFGSEFPPQRR